MNFSIAIDIDAPPERVWAVMSDVERWHEWTASITSVERLDAGPLAVGSRARVKQPRLRPTKWRVTELEPGRRFTWVSRSPGLQVVGHHVVEAAGKGSRATLSLQFIGLLGPLVGRFGRSLVEEYLGLEAAGLKRRSESTPSAGKSDGPTA